MTKNNMADAFLFLSFLLLPCTFIVCSIIEITNAPPVKDVATAYAESLLPGKQYRVVCSDGGAPTTCAIVCDDNVSITVIPIRCGRQMGSCSVRGSQ